MDLKQDIYFSKDTLCFLFWKKVELHQGALVLIPHKLKVFYDSIFTTPQLVYCLQETSHQLILLWEAAAKGLH